MVKVTLGPLQVKIAYLGVRVTVGHIWATVGHLRQTQPQSKANSLLYCDRRGVRGEPRRGVLLPDHRVAAAGARHAPCLPPLHRQGGPGNQCSGRRFTIELETKVRDDLTIAERDPSTAIFFFSLKTLI